MITARLIYFSIIHSYNMIVGYIHICQKGEWKRSLGMIIRSLKKTGLYETSHIIRLGIVSDDGDLKPDPILDEPKFEIAHIGKSKEYERPTLLHMKKSADTDPSDTLYYYLHTKGIKHFGTDKEQNVIDWIELMLYWNIERWDLAVQALKTYDMYGCNHIHGHYSGNFWWATIQHVKKLHKSIGNGYCDPEMWAPTHIECKKKNIYGSGLEGFGHYNHRYPRDKYL